MSDAGQGQVMPGGIAAPPAPAGGPARPGTPWVLPVRIVGVVVALGVLAAATVEVVGTFFERRQTQTRVFDESISRIRVGTDTGDVRVVAGGAGEAVRVTSRRTESFRDARMSARVEGGTLDVTGSCDENGWWFFHICSVDFEIRVPPGMILQLESRTGDVEAVGAVGPVTATSHTGDVTVDGATGPVRVRSDTGDVDGVALGTDTVRAETDTGDVRLAFAGEPRTVEAGTDTGDVDVSVPSGTTAYRVIARTDVGETEIDVPSSPTAERLITLTTSTGDIRVGHTGR